MDRVDFSPFKTDHERLVIAKLSWMLETLADVVDDWFPDDKEPIVQEDLRKIAAILQDRFNFLSLREKLGEEKAKRLIDDVKVKA